MSRKRGESVREQIVKVNTKSSWRCRGRRGDRDFYTRVESGDKRIGSFASRLRPNPAYQLDSFKEGGRTVLLLEGKAHPCEESGA